MDGKKFAPKKSENDLFEQLQSSTVTHASKIKIKGMKMTKFMKIYFNFYCDIKKILSPEKCLFTFLNSGCFLKFPNNTIAKIKECAAAVKSYLTKQDYALT